MTGVNQLNGDNLPFVSFGNLVWQHISKLVESLFVGHFSPLVAQVVLGDLLLPGLEQIEALFLLGFAVVLLVERELGEFWCQIDALCDGTIAHSP